MFDCNYFVGEPPGERSAKQQTPEEIKSAGKSTKLPKKFDFRGKSFHLINNASSRSLSVSCEDNVVDIDEVYSSVKKTFSIKAN